MHPFAGLCRGYERRTGLNTARKAVVRKVSGSEHESFRTGNGILEQRHFRMKVTTRGKGLLIHNVLTIEDTYLGIRLLSDLS